MNGYSDSFHKKADDHEVCQDYATSIDNINLYFANLKCGILSDGCSSAHDSEIGSRILVQAMQNYVSRNMNVLLSMALATGHANAIKQSIGLDGPSLYATLMLVWSDDENLHTAVQGDGFFIAKRKSGLYDIIQYGFQPRSAPYYPAYWMEPNSHKSYLNEFKDQKLIKSMWEFDPDAGLKTISVETMPQFDMPNVVSWSLEDYEMAAVLSDGFAGFYTGTPDNKKMVPLAEICKEILAFKNFTGSFIQRRMTVAFKRIAELGWRTADDFSCAGVSYV